MVFLKKYYEYKLHDVSYFCYHILVHAQKVIESEIKDPLATN